MGKVPNLIGTMVQSPEVAKAYLDFSHTLSKGQLDSKTRERIALAVAEVNGCGYCLSAHSAIGAQLGMSSDQLESARKGEAEDPVSSAIVTFAKKVAIQRGKIGDDDLVELRQQVKEDRIALEIVGNVVLNVLTNYVNNVARTEIDFPQAQPLRV